MEIKNILITGGAGFVGSNIAIYLKEKYPDYKIYALDNLKRRGSELNIPRLREYEINFIHGDIRNSEDLFDLKNKNIDTNKIASDIIQHFLRHAVRDGFFHADMHQGNIFIDKNGHIVPIDFGIMGRLDKLNKRFLAEILFGFIQRDYKKVAEVHLVAGLVPKSKGSYYTKGANPLIDKLLEELIQVMKV